MIKIDFQEPTHNEWINWREECRRKQEEHNNAIPRQEADARVYARMKESVYLCLDGPFHGKCAYCEKIIVNNQHADIEHFRPKGAIKDKNGKRIKIIINGIEEDHSGYYWLAYDWCNLLPSCQLCNQPNKRRGEGAGKRNYFPLLDEKKRAISPGEENLEQPLLINPILESPEEFIGVCSNGLLFAKDGENGRGQTCIETFGLNYRGLSDERARVYEDTLNLVILVLSLQITAPEADFTRAKREKLEKIQAGCEEFSAAARLAIKDAKRRLAPLLEPLIDEFN